MKVISFSNVENTVFSGNTASNFYISLLEDIETKNCEIALLEFGFRVTKESYLIHVPDRVLLWAFKDFTKFPANISTADLGNDECESRVLMLPGFYHSVQHLLRGVRDRVLLIPNRNPNLHGNRLNFNLYYPKRWKGTNLDIHGNDFYTPLHLFSQKPNWTAGYRRIVMNSDSPLKQSSFLFVYCDMIRPHVTGDATTQNMRMIPLRNTDRIQHINFRNPYFFFRGKRHDKGTTHYSQGRIRERHKSRCRFSLWECWYQAQPPVIMKVISLGYEGKTLFPLNSESDFQIHLPEMINTEDCEVALLEIYFRIETDKTDTRFSKPVSMWRYRSPRGDVTQSTYFLPGIFRDADKKMSTVRFHLDIIERSPIEKDIIRFKPIYPVQTESYAFVTKHRNSVGMGIASQRDKYGERKMKISFLQYNTKETQNFVFVYSDIMKQQMFGDTLVRNLRIVPIAPRRGLYDELQCFQFEKPLFYPIGRDRITNVRVAFRDSHGKRLKLHTVYLSLGVRPISI